MDIQFLLLRLSLTALLGLIRIQYNIESFIRETILFYVLKSLE